MPGKKRDAAGGASAQKELWAADSARTAELQGVHSSGVVPMIRLRNKLGVYNTDGEPLRAEDAVPESPGLVVCVDQFLSDEECDKMLQAVNSVALNHASKTDINPKKGEAFLNRDNLTYSDPALSAVLWERLRPLLGEFDGRMPAGFHPSLRYYKYCKGQRFDQHVDVAVRHEGCVSEYTLLLYLNGVGEVAPGETHPLEGGSTVFFATAKRVLLDYAPRKGALLLHAHGPRCLMHEGAEVTKGAKYVFRTDLLYPAKKG